MPDERLSRSDDQEYLQLALDATRIGTWELDLNTGHGTADSRAAEIFGSPAPVSFTADEWVDRVHPVDRSRALEQIRRSLHQEGAFDLELRICPPDGGVRWVRLVGRTAGDVHEQPARVYGVVIDRTERRQREEELQWIARRARCILWSADVFETDHPLYLSWVQTFPEQAAQEFVPLELEPGESYRAAWYRCRLPEDRDRCDELAGQSIRAGRDYEQEFRIECADGAIRWVREDISVETVIPAQHWRVIAVATDVTEPHRVSEELEEANRRKDDFLAMLAHELRNPLAAVSNAVHVLGTASPGSTAYQRAQQTALRQLQHQTRLVSDLLDVSRITREKLELKQEPLNLADLVRETTEDNRASLEATGHILVVETPGAPVPACGDPTRLAQAIGNLLDNAGKFTPRGGTIRVRVEESADGRHATVSVSDNGAGMDPELLPRIWDAFTQADQTLDRSRGGLGLGLALVKGLVEMHGGTVEASSAGVGHGSEILITLPLLAITSPVQPTELTPPENTAPEDPAPAEEPSSSRPRRVLVIEDNLAAAESLRDLLELVGWEVAVAASGTEGLEEAARFQPETVLCDIGLPGMDGYEVARELLQRQPSLRILAISGYDGDDVRRQSREAGFERHLTKPVNPSELLALLARSSHE